MTRVDLEGFGQRLGGPGTVLRGEGAGEQVVEPRVLAGGLGRLAERFGRQCVVFFFQGELGRGVIGIQEVGLLLGDDVVKLIQHLTRIGATEQEEPPDGDEPLRRGIAPRPTLNEPFDRKQLGTGVAVVAVQAIDVAAQQM